MQTVVLPPSLDAGMSFPFAEPPTPGSVVQVATGVYWLRMPLPFALDHINLWLLRDEIDGQKGWTVVDCGISSDTIRANWERVFDTANEGDAPAEHFTANQQYPLQGRSMAVFRSPAP